MLYVYILVSCVSLVTINACADPSVAVNVHVYDENGSPVNRASVKGVFWGVDGINKEVVMLTNGSGYAEVVGGSYFPVKIIANKQGYYKTNLEVSTKQYVGGVVVYGNRDIKVILREKLKPVSLYAKKYKGFIPVIGEWVAFDLEGVESNQSAIGAEVRLFWDSKEQVQVVNSASGFSSQNQRPVHFGLGSSERVDKVVIEWPSGRTETLENPQINKKIHQKM